MLGAFLLQRRLLGGRSFETVGPRPHRSEQRALGAAAPAIAAIFLLIVLLAAGLPLLAVFGTAFSRTISGGLALDNLGWRNFALVLDDRSGALQAIRNSIALGLAAALITGTVGALAAYIVTRTRLPGRRIIDALTILPNAVPESSSRSD